MNDAINQSVVPLYVVNIAVDTARLYSQTSGPYSNTGIYMMDNNLNGGSTGEGGLELHSQVTTNASIGFNVFPIDNAGNQGDTVEIEAFEVSNGTDIFGNWGYPKKQDSGAYQWIGRVFNQGECTYQIKIAISIGGAPKKYFWWDPSFTSTS